MDNNNLINGIFGFVIGVLASIIAWIITTKLIVPKVEFSKNIAKTRQRQSEVPIYKFCMRNKGKRMIIDIDIYFRVRIQGINEEQPTIWRVFTIPLNVIGNKCIYLKPTSKKFYGSEFTIKINECEEFTHFYYPEDIKNKYMKGELTLEDIFNIGKDAYAEIIIFGYDNLSGARKCFISHKYSIVNIIEGKFASRSMDIIKNY
jgi:hypothetical protein